MKKRYLIVGTGIILTLLVLTLTFFPRFNKDYLLTESFGLNITEYTQTDQIKYRDGIIELKGIEPSDEIYLMFFFDKDDYLINNGPFWGPFGRKVYDQEPIYSFLPEDTDLSDGRRPYVLYIPDEKKMIFLFSSASGA